MEEEEEDKGTREKRKRAAQEGGLGGVWGQFVIKLKIPSAEEADERVTNGHGIETGRPRVAVT